jgi:hypothetical protein
MMRSLVSVIACLLLAGGIAVGQAARGTITGTVADPAGAVIPGASIEAKNSETGALYKVGSTSTGNYTLGDLPSGAYELSVSVPGFKKFVRSGITVMAAQILRIDIRLEVGAISETVTVNADAPLLRTESGDLAHTIGGSKLSDLPVVGFSQWLRSPLNVAQMMPGTLVGEQSYFRVNGAPNFSQSIRIEGQDASNTTMPAAPVQNQASVEAIEEYTVQTSNFAAEYGQAGGGLVNLTMKSGSNSYHGSLYDYFANEALNGYLPWLHTRNRNRRNDWGFTLSGPFSIPKLYNARDKTFFFFSLEQMRNKNTAGNVTWTVPTDAYRSGDFRQALTGRVATQLDPLGRKIYEGTIYDPATDRVAPDGRRVRDPFSDNMIPSNRFDPVALKIQDLIPRANYGTGALTNFVTSYDSSDILNIPVLKIDQNLGAKFKVSFYYSSTEEVNTNAPITADGIDTKLSSRNDTNTNYVVYRLSFDYSLSPTKLLHLGAGHQGSWWPLLPYYSIDQLKELGLPGSYANYFPRIGALSNSTTGGFSRSMGTGSASMGNSLKPTANASLTWVKTNHTYKFGAEMRIDGNIGASYVYARGVYNFNAEDTGLAIPGFPTGGYSVGFPYATFLLGRVNNGNIGYPTNMRWGKNAWAVFAQDSWKVTRKLTIDYGLRWDYQTYLKEQYGRIPNFSPTTPNPSAGNLPGAVIFEGGPNPVEFAKVYPYAFGPRLGIAYQFIPKTVLRGGIGISYGQTPSDRGAITGMGSSNPFSTPSYGDPIILLKDGAPAPTPWPNFDPGQYPTQGTTTSPPYAYDRNGGRPSRQIQWSFGIQREITHNLTVEASYVGNRGAWWEANSLINVNALTAEGLAKYGLDVNNATDRTLLTLPLSSSQVQARGFKAPYAGFPMTSTLAQALRPFPQFGTINYSWAPLGRTWYDSLQVKVTKRYSHGIDLNSGFTWQKELMMGAESYSGGGASVNDVFNRPTNKYISTYSRPYSLYVSLNYTTPKFAGLPKALSSLMRDWTYGAVLQYASAMPITVPTANTRLSSYLFRGTFANRVEGQPLFVNGKGEAIDINCKSCYDPRTDFVLNPKAWVDPPEGQFSTSPARYNDYRQHRSPSESMSLGRIFRFKEKAQLSIRADFRNIFNRAVWTVTTTTNATALPTRNATTGTTTSGFGYITTIATTSAAGTAPRMGLVVARISF